MKPAAPDRSNGYEAFAADFTRARNARIGPSVVRKWANKLPAGASVLDLGCGHGVPISQVLIEEGLDVYGVDASETLVNRFHERFPDVPVECSAAEDSDFFGRTFDAVVAWGLFFLLAAETQQKLIGKVSRALNPGGQFLFTAPRQICTWTDATTGQPSVSLGQEAYDRELSANGMVATSNDEDEGENYYYFATKS